MKIFVIDPTGKEIELDIEPTDTIKDVKVKIQRTNMEEHYPIYYIQHLSFDGMRLEEDGRTVSDYGIQAESKLVMRVESCNICDNSLNYPSMEYFTTPSANGLKIAVGKCGHAFHLDCLNNEIQIQRSVLTIRLLKIIFSLLSTCCRIYLHGFLVNLPKAARPPPV